MSTSDTPARAVTATTNDPAAPEAGAASAAAPCPQCGAPLTVHERFPTWCPSCDWNVVPPKPRAENLTARAQRRAERDERREEKNRQAVRARTEQVFQRVATGGSGLRDGSEVGMHLLAGLVNLVSLLVLALAVGLLTGVLLPGWTGRALGVIALAVAVTVRPRLGRPQRDGVLTREAAPALYGLVDRVSAELNAPKVDSIVIDDKFNAAFGVLGLRRHRQLRIGLPLWVTLTRQQKVALLGHEIGHCVNGDPRRGLWTGSAVRALAEWYRLTVPSPDNARANNLAVLVAGLIANMVLWVVHRAVEALTLLMYRLHLRSGQAAEYRADLMAARLASVAGAQGMLRAIFNGPTVEAVVLRQRALPHAGAGRGRTGAGQAPDLWEALAEAVRTIPATEAERRLRESERKVDTTDPSHPPTYLRLRMLTVAPPEVDRPALVLDAGQAAAIEAELAPSRARVAAELL